MPRRNPNLFVSHRILEAIQNRGREGGTQAPFIMAAKGVHSIRRWNNNPPFFNSFTVDENTGIIGSTFQFDVSASDFDNDTLTYSWNISGPGSPSLSLSNANKRATFTAAARGDYTITVSVSDEFETVSQTKTVSVINRAPTQNTFTIDKTSGFLNDSFVLTMVSNTDPDGDPVTITWSGISSDQISVSNPSSVSSVATVTPTSTGVFTIAATIADDQGGSNTYSKTFSVALNSAPSLSLSLDKTTGNISDSFTATATATDPENAPLSYTWFLNGAEQTGQTGASLTVTPGVRGSYTVKAVVNDGYNEVYEEASFDIENRVPTQNTFTVDKTSGYLGDSFVLTMVSNADPDGDPITINWSGISSDQISTSNPTALSSVATVTPTSAGTFTITATVSDGAGGTYSNSETINVVANTIPTVSLSVTPTEGFIDTSFDVTSTITNLDAGKTLTYSWADNGGAMSSLPPSATGVSLSQAARGTHTVSVTVDDGYNTSTSTITYEVVNRIPSLGAITISPSTTGNQDTVFTASVTASNLDSDDVITYSWSFTGAPGGSSPVFVGTGNSVTFDPPDRIFGDYTLSVVASDQFGGTSSPSTATVTVENRAPTISSFTVDSASGYITDQFTFDVVASDPDGSALTYVWDSNVLSSTFTTSNGGRTATYRPRGTMITGGYKGDHVITVTVSDPDGGEVTSNALTVAIADRPPVASLTYSGTTNTGETITLDAAGSSDPDGDTVEYAWSFVSKPASSTATFTTAAATATFPADVAGDYTVRLTVTSGTPPMSDSEDVTITITTLTSYPTVTITPTAYPDPGDGSFVPEWPMEIAGAASDSGGNPVTSGVTWNWSLSGPVGHACFLDDGTGDNGSSFSSVSNVVSFMFDSTTTGTYTVSLYASTATETGDTETYTFTVNTLPPSGP